MTKINDGGPELKPCPFCGGEAWLNDYEAKHSALPARSRSPQCKSCGGSLGYHPTAAKAIAAWNRRADLVPAPSVTVKPLEWADLGDGTFRALLPIIGSIRVEPYGCCDWWEVLWSMPGQCDKLIPDVFDSPDDAKAAAQADYEARIMAAIQIGPRRATPEALASLRAGEGFATSGSEARWIEDMEAGVYDEDMPTPSVTIPDGHPDLNLSAWIDLRRKQVGPWADYIITEVGKLEQEIARMRSGAPGWQPIKTAPRDGSRFMGFWPSAIFQDTETPASTWWEDGSWHTPWEDAPEDHPYAPTHWMPLPAPPSEDKP